MITSLIVFALSGIFVAYMFWSKRDEVDNYANQLVSDGVSLEERPVHGSTTLLSTSICSTDLDIKLRAMYQRSVAWLQSIDGKYIREKMHQLAEYSERRALAILAIILSRFGRARDIVTGKDLPKNKGSVSFFLKHMIHHKSQIGAYLPDTLEEGGEGATFKTLDPRLQKKLEINRK